MVQWWSTRPGRRLHKAGTADIKGAREMRGASLWPTRPRRILTAFNRITARCPKICPPAAIDFSEGPRNQIPEPDDRGGRESKPPVAPGKCPENIKIPGGQVR